MVRGWRAAVIFGLKVTIIVLKFGILLITGFELWSHVSDGSVSLVPHTSVAFPLSGLFCGSLTLSREVWDDSEAALAWDATLYVLSEEPEYEKTFNFTIANDNITLSEGEGVRWYMRYVYLHKGSIFTVNSCLTRGNGKLCVVKGEKSYNKWASGHYKCKDLEYICEHTLADCASNTTHQSTHLSIGEDAAYYFIHYTESYNLQVSIAISSIDYDSNTTPNSTCSNFNTCSVVSIPMNFRGYGLVTAAVTVNITNQLWSWEDTIKVSWSCESAFLPYFLIVGIPLMVVFTIYFVSCICCCKYCDCLNECCRKERKYKGCSWYERRAHFIVWCMVIFIPIAVVFAFVEGFPLIAYIIATPSGLVLIPGSTKSFFIRNEFFCSSLSISTEGSSRLSASLYLTNAAPSLNQSSTKTISEVFTCDGNKGCFRYWRALMKKNSSLNVTGHSIGDAYFIEWNITRMETDTVQYYFSELLSHPEEFVFNRKHVRIPIQGNFSHSYCALREAEYIFIVFGNHSLVNVTLQFDFSEYSIPLDHQPACETHSYTKTECTAPIPQGASNAILKVSNDAEMGDDSFEYLTVDTVCNIPASSRITIGLPLLVVNYAIFFPIFLMCIVLKLREKMRGNERQPLLVNAESNLPKATNYQRRFTESRRDVTGKSSLSSISAALSVSTPPRPNNSVAAREPQAVAASDESPSNSKPRSLNGNPLQ